MPLIQTSDAIAYIGAPESATAYLSLVIPGVIEAVARYIAKPLEPTVFNRTLNGHGGQRMPMSDIPLQSVQSVTINGQTIPQGSSTPMTPGWFADTSRHLVLLTGPYEFTRGVQNVQIALTAGFDPAPADIKLAALEWVKLTYHRRGRSSDVVSQKAGPHSQTFGSSLPMPPTVALMLRPHVRVTP